MFYAGARAELDKRVIFRAYGLAALARGRFF